MHNDNRLQGSDEEQPPLGDPADALDERTRVSHEVQRLIESGDLREAIKVMMEAHGDMIFAYCVRTLRDRSLAEDVRQQVFLEAFRDLKRFGGRATPATWLCGIAAHRCIDAIRQRGRQSDRFEPSDDELMAAQVDPTSAPGERLEHARIGEALADCLQGLSPEVRATVLLRHLGEMSYEEMALMLDARADTLCARVARALPLLKECLEKKGWNRE